MHSSGSAGQSAVSATGSVTGHSYTAAYRYQLVIGKVGGWAIPYPLTIPQAVTGLSAVVLAMITASWWYPLTGMSGLLGVVALPIVGIRVISRIRPEGRSVSDWLYGWGVAQGHGLTGRGVRLHVGIPCPVNRPDAVPAMGSPVVSGSLREERALGVAHDAGVPTVPDALDMPSALPRNTASRQRRSAPPSSPRRTTQSCAPRAKGLTGLLNVVLAGGMPRSANAQPQVQGTSAARAAQPAKLGRSAPPLRTPRPHQSGRTPNRRKPAPTKSRWSLFTRFFSTPTPTPEPARVPVFDPWGVSHTQGGM